MHAIEKITLKWMDSILSSAWFFGYALGLGGLVLGVLVGTGHLAFGLSTTWNILRSSKYQDEQRHTRKLHRVEKIARCNQLSDELKVQADQVEQIKLKVNALHGERRDAEMDVQGFEKEWLDDLNLRLSETVLGIVRNGVLKDQLPFRMPFRLRPMGFFLKDLDEIADRVQYYRESVSGHLAQLDLEEYQGD